MTETSDTDDTSSSGPSVARAALFRIQELETVVEQLDHRLAHLPEQAELNRAHEAVQANQAGVDDAEARRYELVRNQKRKEDDLAAIETRVSSGARNLWEATGGEVAAGSRSVADGLARRYGGTADARSDLRRHGSELLDAALAADPGAAATAFRGIGSDLGTLWERFASNEIDERDNPER